MRQEVLSQLKNFSSTAEGDTSPNLIVNLSPIFLCILRFLGTAINSCWSTKWRLEVPEPFSQWFPKTMEFPAQLHQISQQLVIAKNSLLIFLPSASAGLAELFTFPLSWDVSLIVHYAVFLWSTYPIANNFRLMAEGRLDSDRRFEPGTGSQERLSSWTRSATKSGIHIKQSHMTSDCRMIWFSVQRRKRVFERGPCLGAPLQPEPPLQVGRELGQVPGHRAATGTAAVRMGTASTHWGRAQAGVLVVNANKLAKCTRMKFSCWKIHSIKTFILYSLLSANPAQTH